MARMVRSFSLSPIRRGWITRCWRTQRSAGGMSATSSQSTSIATTPAKSAGRLSTGRSPPTTRWASITPGAAPTRTCTSATRPCAATTSAGRTASTARACGSRSRSRRSSASRTSATSRATASAEFVQRCKERVLQFAARHQRAVHSPGPVDGLGRLVLHDVGREQLHHLAVHQDVPRSRLALSAATT